MDNKFIILILVIILFLILFTYKNQENITSESGKTLSDEALQSIASVYNTQNMNVTNLNATNQTLLKDTKISGNLNVSGTIIGNVTGNLTGNVTGNVIGNVTGNVTGDLTGNNITINSINNKTIDNTPEYIWGLAPGGAIYRCVAPCTGGNWENIPGGLSDISIGRDYIYGQNGYTIFRCKKPCDKGNWEVIPGGLARIAGNNSF